MNNLTQKEKDSIMRVNLDYKDVSMFCHCSHCLERYNKKEIGVGMSPHDALSYEAGTVAFTYPDGTTANILAVFCKLCERVVWDSRHLTHLF